MKPRLTILFFFVSSVVCLAQTITSEGDKYFYAYAYDDAIQAYQEQMQQGKTVTNHQRLNLADSYFKTGAYTKAAKIYMDINKNDSILSDHRFNNMLQSLAKTAEKEQIKSLLKSRAGQLAGELMQNAEFNYQLLGSSDQGSSSFIIFSLNVNSAQADLSPTFYKDDLLFSSSRKTKSKEIYGPSGEAYLDIYRADILGAGSLSQPSLFKGIPDSPYHKSTPYYSA
ncbi:MAG TPA: OmpA family protein, partial [Pricia sp.]|nr:OmpA family protein [Pricia sp.]